MTQELYLFNDEGVEVTCIAYESTTAEITGIDIFSVTAQDWIPINFLRKDNHAINWLVKVCEEKVEAKILSDNDDEWNFEIKSVASRCL